MKQLLVIALLVMAVACKDKKEPTFDTTSYERNKESLADKEKGNPARFLKVECKDRKNLIGQTVVKGTISNKASVCTYKDVVIKLSFFSKTAVKLEEGTETIYEVIPPGETIKFKTKYFAPKGTDSASVQILNAAAEVNAE